MLADAWSACDWCCWEKPPQSWNLLLESGSEAASSSLSPGTQSLCLTCWVRNRKHEEEDVKGCVGVVQFPSDRHIFLCASQDVFSFSLQERAGIVYDQHLKDLPWVFSPLPLPLSLCDCYCRWSPPSLEETTQLWTAYACAVKMTPSSSPQLGSK